MTTAVEVGPQYKGDQPFRARMRFHQSWWRAEVLGQPYGNGPTQGGKPLGSCLSPEGAAAGVNFLTPEIHALAMERIAQGGGVEPYRCLHNLLSSQPMCFNLFGPLCLDPTLATKLIDAVVPDVVSQVTDVRIEYAPAPAVDFVGDRSSFDAFIEYLDGDGTPGFIGVETKLTEPFSSKPYDKQSRARYIELTDSPDSPWTTEGQARVDDPRWNQLWRNQLLVEAVRRHPNAPHGTRGSLAVVHHPGDPECGAALSGYRDLLEDPSRCFLDWSLDELVTAWRPLVSGPHAEWLERFNDRYVDVSGSDQAWKAP